MREILFRGKRTDNYEWFEGCFVYDSLHCSIRVFGYEFDVVPETVGQYTGMTDKNNKKIFEGDIVKVRFWSEWGDCWEISTGTIEWDNGKFIIHIDYYCMRLNLNEHPEMEVVGNIHDEEQQK